LDYTTIRAPVDGIVVSRAVDVGQTVAASLQAPTLFTIAQDLTKMQVETSVDEADIGRVKLEDRATFTVDAFSGQTFSGIVTQIRKAAQIVQNVVTYTVVISVDNPGGRLLPGMTANVKLVYAEKPSVLKVPNAALRFRPAGADASPAGPARGQSGVSSTRPAAGSAPRGDGAGGGAGAAAAPGGGGNPGRVWILDADGKPKAVALTLGISDGTATEVLRGDLKEGQEIITGLVAAGQNRPGTPGGSAPAGPRL